MNGSLNIMKQTKLEFDTLLNKIRNTEREFKKEKREEAISQGASCLTCKFTKIAFGKKLNCTMKDKLVSQYNYCEKWEIKK